MWRPMPVDSLEFAGGARSWRINDASLAPGVTRHLDADVRVVRQRRPQAALELLAEQDSACSLVWQGNLPHASERTSSGFRSDRSHPGEHQFGQSRQMSRVRRIVRPAPCQAGTHTGTNSQFLR